MKKTTLKMSIVELKLLAKYLLILSKGKEGKLNLNDTITIKDREGNYIIIEIDKRKISIDIE